MRTTLKIDDDVLAAAKELARRQGRTAGAVLSDLARRALTMAVRGELSVTSNETGFDPLPPRGGIVTNELVDRLREDEGI